MHDDVTVTIRNKITIFYQVFAMTSTYSVLRTLSEFAWAKTCVRALGFSIFVRKRKQTNTTVNKCHVNVLRLTRSSK